MVAYYGMGKSLISDTLMGNPMMGTGAIQAVLGGPNGRRTEVDDLLEDAKRRCRSLLLQKRHVVEGIRDALIEREELIGDEIEEIMAQLGEREPFEIELPSGNGQPSPNGGDGHRRLPAEDPTPPALEP